MQFARALTIVAALVLLVSPSDAFAKATETKSYGEIEPDKALLYAIRPKGARGGNSVAMDLFADTTFLLRLRGNSYGFVQLEPGRHKIWGIGGFDEIEFVPGAAFYLMTGDRGTALLTEDEGRALVETVRYYMPPDPEVEAMRAIKEEKAAKQLPRFERIVKKHQQRVGVAPSSALEKPDDTDGLLHVPVYSPIELELMETVSSYLSTLGEEVWLRVREDALVDGAIWLPAGTPVKGTIAEIHKARRGGGSGGFEIVIPSVVTGNGEKIPLVGQMIDTGRDRLSAASRAAVAGGLFGAALVKGREAFELCGERWRVWTRADAWIKHPETGATAAALVKIDAPRTVTVRSEEDLSFNLEKHREAHDITVTIETEEAIASLVLEVVGDWHVPKPPSAFRIERGTTTSAAIFDGWSLVRHLRHGTEPIPVRFSGTTADGESLVAVGSMTWQEKSPE
jgi:hypothetical protein